jgi:hypothetical protein
MNGGNADDAVNMQHQIQQALTYQPKTADGKALAGAADKALGYLPAKFNQAGEAVTDATGSPLLGAAVNTAGNTALNLLPLKALGRGVGAAADDVALTAPRGAPTTPAEQALQSLNNGKAVGYQLPPNLDPNASNLSRLVQSVAGKVNGEQRAALPNQATTNALGARSLSSPDLGIATDPASLITKAKLNLIRKSAVELGYDPIKDLSGSIPADATFLKENAAIKQAHGDQLSGNPDVGATADMLQKMGADGFDPATITDNISTLRGKAQDAGAAGRPYAASAFRAQATELESLLDRRLSDMDNAPPDMLAKYRAARTLIAQTHTIESNLNPSTGNIDAIHIGQALKDGTSLTGDLKTIADFANAAPAAAVIPKGIPLPSSAATHLAGAALAHATGGASMVAFPAARALAARFIQSRVKNPALLQPADKTLGQSALDAVHGNSVAFNKLYGGGSDAPALGSFQAPLGVAGTAMSGGASPRSDGDSQGSTDEQ